MTKTVALLATLDTKGEECKYLREQIQDLGSRVILVDMGVVGAPTVAADITREAIAEAGGTPLPDLLKNPSRQTAG